MARTRFPEQHTKGLGQEGSEGREFVVEDDTQPRVSYTAAEETEIIARAVLSEARLRQPCERSTSSFPHSSTAA